MVFQSSIRDKSQPDSVSSAIKKQTFETNKLIKQLSNMTGLNYNFFYIYCLSFKDLE